MFALIGRIPLFFLCGVAHGEGIDNAVEVFGRDVAELEGRVFQREIVV